MSKADDLAASRRKADALLGRAKQKDAERLSAVDEQRRVEDAKTTRLREARLAKEAAERPPAAKPNRATAAGKAPR